VDGADTGTSQERGCGLPSHGEVDGDGVALLDAIGFQDVCDAADLAKQFGVGNVAALARLICLVDDGDLIGSDEMDEGEADDDTLSGCLNAHRSTQLYDALRPPSGNQAISPVVNPPDRIVWNGRSQ